MIDLCGGCALSYIPLGEQLSAKRAEVAAALQIAGVTAEVSECVDAHGAGRRRATFHARRDNAGRLLVGFTEARTHNIVDLAEHRCPILMPALQAASEPVRALTGQLQSLKKPIDAVTTVTSAGLDIDLRGTGKISEKQRLGLSETAKKERIARLSLHGDVVLEFRPPTITFGRANVILPPGGFLQATELGEETLARLVLEGVSGAKKTADLFAGCGTFALRIAEIASVKAVEQDRAAVAALDRAWRTSDGLKRVETEARDLFRRPLTVSELNEFDAVVFDPPRAGAEAQAREITRSKVKRVVVVSCNAQTLARDLKILSSGGYKIGAVTPVDQFRHSGHVEAVAILSR